MDVDPVDVLDLDTKLRSVAGEDWFPHEPPYIPGGGVAGRVTAVVDDGDESLIGQRVVARAIDAPTGGYAEQTVGGSRQGRRHAPCTGRRHRGVRTARASVRDRRRPRPTARRVRALPARSRSCRPAPERSAPRAAPSSSAPSATSERTRRPTTATQAGSGQHGSTWATAPLGQADDVHRAVEARGIVGTAVLVVVAQLSTFFDTGNDAAAATTIIGTGAQAASRLRDYAAADADEVVLTLPADDIRRRSTSRSKR